MNKTTQHLIILWPADDAHIEYVGRNYLYNGLLVSFFASYGDFFASNFRFLHVSVANYNNENLCLSF
jgi:hypothetical protein